MRLLPLLGVAVALVAGASASSATVAHPVPVAVAFWDPHHGLAALSTFASCGARSAGEQLEIERTADGGRTWGRLREVCASERITAVGPSTALLSVAGGLLRTTDGGASWSRIRGPSVDALAFTSSSRGWAVTGGLHSLSLQQTHDGGRTWSRLGHPCTAETGRISFVSRTHGWLLCLGEAGAGNQGKSVYETQDGGATWRLQARAPFLVKGVGRLDSYGYPTDVVFRPNGHGWMPQLRGATLTTSDGGRTWSPLAVTSPEARLGVAVSFVSDTTGFLLVQDEVKRRWQLERTDDGGQTWRVVHAWPM
jgi:photosystem II stability/assembly factor-like uncharacterized protein